MSALVFGEFAHQGRLFRGRGAGTHDEAVEREPFSDNTMYERLSR